MATNYRVRNVKGLIPFLSSHRIIYEVVNDGWDVDIITSTVQGFFNVGKMFGSYLAANPELVTLEELQQRGDIPGF